MLSPASSAIKSLINISSIGLILFFSVIMPIKASAYDFNSQSGLNDLAQTTGYKMENSSLESIIGKSLNILFSLLGIAFIFLIIYGGVLWMTDQGNSKNVERAKNVITQAVVGLIIIVAAYAITNFIFKYLRNGEISTTNTVIDQTATSTN